MSERNEQPKSHMRRYVVQGALFTGLVATAGFGIAWALPATPKLEIATDKAAPSKQQAAPEQPPAEVQIEAGLYSRVMRLRQDIAMTNGDLAALGLNQDQAEDVLARLLEWVETNQPALIQADNAAEAAKQALVELERRVRVGEADKWEAEGLAALHGAVAEARAACKSLADQAGNHAIAPAPAEVRGQWEKANSYAHLPLDMRHLPGLDQRMVEDLLEAVSAQMTQSGATSDGGGDLASALPFSSVQSMDGVRAMIQARLPGVREAEREVLPLPEELREPEDTGRTADEEAAE